MDEEREREEDLNIKYSIWYFSLVIIYCFLIENIESRNKFGRKNYEFVLVMLNWYIYDIFKWRYLVGIWFLEERVGLEIEIWEIIVWCSEIMRVNEIV